MLKFYKQDRLQPIVANRTKGQHDTYYLELVARMPLLLNTILIVPLVVLKSV